MENIAGFLLLIMAVGAIIQIISLPYQWRKYKTPAKIIVGIALPIQIFSVTALFLMNWGSFPWGRASAFETANRFLSEMKKGNYVEATQYMQPCVQKFLGIDSLGNISETRPTSWQWTNYENNSYYVSTIGTAKFIDGAELRIEAEWKWNGYKWELFGLIFGEPYKNARTQFSLGCHDIYRDLDFLK